MQSGMINLPVAGSKGIIKDPGNSSFLVVVTTPADVFWSRTVEFSSGVLALR